MTNLFAFTRQLENANLHANARFAFDWPGIFPTLPSDVRSLVPKNERYGFAVISNFDIGGTDHNELSIHVDGHSIPVLGTPKLATSASMTLLLDNSIVDGTYGKLLNKMYLDKAYGSFAGLANTTNVQTTQFIGNIAKLFVLNNSYAYTKAVDLTESPHISLHYPRVKSVGNLNFDAQSGDVSRCSVELVFAWLEHSE